MSVDLNYTDRRLVTERDDGSFVRNAKSLFNLIILHDPVINKIILKMQDKIIQNIDPQSVRTVTLPKSWQDYHSLLMLD